MKLYVSALIVGVMAGLVGIWKDEQQSPKKIIFSFFLSLCLLISSAYAAYEHYQTQKREKYTKTWGAFDISAPINRKPSFFVGRYQINSMMLGNDKWEAWLENGKINLRGTVRDRDGNIVFQVNGTDWKNWTGKDFNYDDSALEVMDAKGNIIFQLEFDKHENKVSIFGIFYFGPEQLVLVGREENTNVMGQSTTSEAEVNAFMASIKPLFKYPRENHLGERVSKKQKL